MDDHIATTDKAEEGSQCFLVPLPPAVPASISCLPRLPIWRRKRLSNLYTGAANHRDLPRIVVCTLVAGPARRSHWTPVDGLG